MDPQYKKKLESLGFHFGIQSRIESPMNRAECRTIEDLPGVKSENSLGEFFYQELSYPEDYNHGIVTFQDLTQKTSRVNLPDNHTKINLRDCIFLDTETTGLAQSGGTFAFMIGVGFFNEAQFHLRQYFLVEPSQEDAMLLDLLNLLEQFSTIVSYNGISFDVPIIKSRIRYHRLPSDIHRKDHIDLLKYARMLFRFQFNDRSLKNMEFNVLKFYRSEEEIPGYLAPVIYKEYLENKEIEKIEGVFYHNAMDIISLAAFISIVNEISSQNKEYYDKYETLNFSIAKQYEKNKIFEKALETYEITAKQTNLSDNIKINCYLSLARIYKKQNQVDLAINNWYKAAKYNNLEAHIELAKVYEHNLRNYTLAIEFCQKALSILENEIESITNKRLIEACKHRLNRLLVKANL
jgi:uncharacterized protein YprB with RNaseH-like and TPR domain